MNMIGVFYNYLFDLAQRRSFSDIRRYIKAETLIEEQKTKKVRLSRCHTEFVCWRREVTDDVKYTALIHPLQYV